MGTAPPGRVEAELAMVREELSAIRELVRVVVHDDKQPESKKRKG
jgi:hypothetical protein